MEDELDKKIFLKQCKTIISNLKDENTEYRDLNLELMKERE